MTIEDEYIRLIFGLKLKQIRTEKKLSLFGLAKFCGYDNYNLNEIEKGKKYPKTDKILILSEKLETPYDHLVSLKLDKNLAPIGEILQSKILKEKILELFGIKENNLIVEKPQKINPKINPKDVLTNKKATPLASLRSYQEAHSNYFEEIENDVERFAKSYHLDISKRVLSKELKKF